MPLDLVESLGEQQQEAPKLTRVEKALTDAARVLIKDAANNLIRSKAVATGKLSDLKASELYYEGDFMHINIYMPFYWRFVDEGVNGIENHRGSPYSFRKRTVSKDMVNGIKQWMQIRGVRGTRAKKYGPHSGLEQKDISIEGKAYAVAIGIKKNGVKRTKFFTNAIDKMNSTIEENIIVSLGEDILNSFK